LQSRGIRSSPDGAAGSLSPPAFVYWARVIAEK
jgi:hypothetical protein